MSDLPTPEVAISVVVRSHNDEKWIGRTLGMLSNQTRRDVEIVSIDDRSTDRTPEIIAGFPDVRRVDPPPGRYVPGRILNAAVRACRGAIVVFNNSDSIPLSEDYLAVLTSPLESGAADAVFGNQLPRPDAEILVRKDNERAFGDGVEAARWNFFFSLASSATRREELLRYPFDENLQYSEDVDWAWKLRGRGGRVCYVPEARVEHSHNYRWRELWKRFYQEGIADRIIFGLRMSYPVAFRRFAAETARDEWYLLRHGRPDLFWQPPIRRFIQKFAQCRGTRSRS